MTLKVGDKLPDATLLKMDENGIGPVSLGELLTGRSVVIFAVPAAYSGLCSNAHVPSFIRTADQFRAKGVDDVICIAVNDPFVLAAWEKVTGAADAGILTLGDPEGTFTSAVGMMFSAPAIGLINRSIRYALHAVDGEVKALQLEEAHGVCDLTGGEALLAEI